MHSQFEDEWRQYVFASLVQSLWCKWLVQHFWTERLRVRSRRSATMQTVGPRRPLKVFACLVQWGLCALRHSIQISMEAILSCHPARSTKWLDCHPKSCELWRIRTGPISRWQDTFAFTVILQSLNCSLARRRRSVTMGEHAAAMYCVSLEGQGFGCTNGSCKVVNGR